MTEWYLGEDWDIDAKALFEQKLKKARGTYNKAQYLRIKGSCLLKASNFEKRIEGVRLMERVINTYPEEISHVMFAYEQLGDYYFREKKMIEAEFNYRQSISFFKKHGRSGTSGISDIKLAEIIIETGQKDKFTEMYHLLVDEFKKNDGTLTLRDDIFKYCLVLAKITNELNKREESKIYAQKALDVAGVNKPQFEQYPQVGIVQTNNEELNLLNSFLRK